MRRHDSSSGDEEDNGVTAMDTSATNNKHKRIPPPVKLNGIKSNPASPQRANGRHNRPASASRNPGAPVRYFILKSHNRENVERSIDKGVWSTQVRLQSLFRSVLSHLFPVPCLACTVSYRMLWSWGCSELFRLCCAEAQSAEACRSI